jgi:hypothetical protein
MAVHVGLARGTPRALAQLRVRLVVAVEMGLST